MRIFGSHAVALTTILVGLTAACGQPPSPTEKAPAQKDQAPSPAPPPAASPGPQLLSSDLYHLTSVGDVQLSPDSTRVAYSVVRTDRPGRPYSQVRIMDIAKGTSVRLGSDDEAASGPRWSPDGQSIAYFGREDTGTGLVVSRADGSGATLIAPVSGTNHPLPSSGERLAWSPDGKQIAFISATPGPETENANGDPMVITRYLYKPTASEGLTRFNDNRRLHIFVADVGSKQVRQLTTGDYYEHSIDWSPRGDELVFISNREPDPDRFFNYNIFAVKVADGVVRQITDTKSAEYNPVWSPDGRTIAYVGTTRPLTSSETTMEDTHVWVVDADGRNRRELGGAIDNRQGRPGWSPEGDAVYCTIQERGNNRLYRLTVSGGQPQVVTPSADERGSVGSWSSGGGAKIAYTLTTVSAPSELYVKVGSGPARALTRLNEDLLGKKTIAEVDSVTFKSFDGTAVEAFLTKPAALKPTMKYPLIAMIKGGPHGQQGPAFNSKAQVYAGQGFAVLMVNYRGSTGYGQKFTDAIFNDQDGGEGKDVLAGVDAALAKYPWLDANRLGIEGGSYGGQLTDWLITQTPRFKAAIPAAGIANLVSFNYMSYYHDYLAVEFGVLPHQSWTPNGTTAPRRLADFLWERSALRYVANVRTPVMFVHGENDNDVPIAEAEQYFIALKDAGVETIMVRYPREGHGIRETKHQVDIIDRSMAWYERHFQAGTAAGK
jgi:dipeptidyl aminopeptidase/acylaminoacyl peptidase